MLKWLLGIPYEVAFWDATYANKKVLAKTLAFSHYGRELSLDGFDAAGFLLAQAQPEEAKILDIGCGMTYMPGEFIVDEKGQQRQLNIHYIDPLANYYNDIAAEYHVQVPKVEFGMMEHLSAFYPEHDVTLALIQNALDHSANPVKGILEALNALKKGGKLYLNHHPNEAEYENYRGFHQFNICIEQDELIIWNREQQFNVNDIVKDFARVETKIVEENPIAILTKTAEVPVTLLDHEQDIRTLSTALLELTRKMNDASFMRRYHRQYRFYRLAQKASKLFSWQTRQKIKKFIKKLKI